uniref:Uncharacterized protein n=1 Tax=Heterorhabditis bacteriophora TaxID=37862 RepID=A0A1I7WI75_HETBA
MHLVACQKNFLWKIVTGSSSVCGVFTRLGTFGLSFIPVDAELSSGTVLSRYFRNHLIYILIDKHTSISKKSCRVESGENRLSPKTNWYGQRSNFLPCFVARISRVLSYSHNHKSIFLNYFLYIYTYI